MYVVCEGEERGRQELACKIELLEAFRFTEDMLIENVIRRVLKDIFTIKHVVIKWFVCFSNKTFSYSKKNSKY